MVLNIRHFACRIERVEFFKSAALFALQRVIFFRTRVGLHVIYLRKLTRNSNFATRNSMKRTPQPKQVLRLPSTLSHVRWFVRYKLSPFNISTTVRQRITTFHTDIHTHLLFGHTWYDVNSYFRSAVIAKNCRKCLLRRLRVEFFENGSSKDQEIVQNLSGIAGLTSL